MLVVVALFVWFALSIPATVIIGRILAAASGDNRVRIPFEEPARVPTDKHHLVRS